MYGLTYVGRMFNVVTLLIAAWIFIFSAPKVYKDNQVQTHKIICKITFFFKLKKKKLRMFFCVSLLGQN